MNKGKKVALAILFDMAFLVAIVFAVSTIIGGSDCAWKITLSKIVIVLLIPCMFYMTYMSVSGDKYDTLPDELLDDEEESSDTESANALSGTKQSDTEDLNSQNK